MYLTAKIADYKNIMNRSADRLEMFTGYTFKERAEICVDGSAALCSFACYVSDAMARMHNRPELAGKILIAPDFDEQIGEVLDKRCPEVTNKSYLIEEVLTHENAHLLHFQNDPDLNSFCEYNNMLWTAKHDALRLDKKTSTTLGIDDYALRRLSTRVDELMDRCQVEFEGFATWVTSKVLSRPPSPIYGDNYNRAYHVYNTIENAFGAHNVVRIAMMPRKSIGHIMRYWNEACDKLESGPEILVSDRSNIIKNKK
jgi:hypothetical protein